jgi:glycosyltransferase involved in cell wall biosynthesis
MGSGRPAPWIAFHHGFTNRGRKDRVYNHVARWALKGADRLVAVCDAFARDLRAAGVPAEQIRLRHNFVLPFTEPPPAEVDALRARFGIPAGTEVLLAVGRLSREKGHADLLEALAMMLADDTKRSSAPPAFRLVIAGEGPERTNLEAQVKRLGLEDVVILAGHQPNVRPFYALADCMVLPSHSEGSPNVLLEAMSAGLPIVATDAGGVVEIASDGITALIVPKRDPQAFAAAVQRLRSDHELARGLAAQAQRAAARYTPEAYIEAMIAIYRSVLEEK